MLISRIFREFNDFFSFILCSIHGQATRTTPQSGGGGGEFWGFFWGGKNFFPFHVLVACPCMLMTVRTTLLPFSLPDGKFFK